MPDAGQKMATSVARQHKIMQVVEATLALGGRLDHIRHIRPITASMKPTRVSIIERVWQWSSKWVGG